MADNKLDIKEAFNEYAKKELEFYQTAKKDKIYIRVLPSFKDHDRGLIDFFYNGVKIGGHIYKNLITLDKLQVTKYGNENSIDEAIAKVEESIKIADMTCDNQLK